MKKKLVALGLAVVLALSATACGSSTELNNVNVRTASIVIDTIDDYIDGDISASAAYDIVENAYHDVDYSDLPGLYLQTYVATARLQLLELKYGSTGDFDELIDARNEVADLAGLKKRK